MKHRKECKIIIICALIILAVVAFWNILYQAIIEMKYLKSWEIIAMAFVGIIYQLMDGLNFTTMIKINKPDYKRREGIECAFYTSFFRVTSFGSAPYVGTSYDLFKRGVPLSEGVAISAINYTIHKIIIALLCLGFGLYTIDTIVLLGDKYLWYFILSLFLVIPIAIFLIGFCTSIRLHQIIIFLLRKADKRNKNSEKIAELDSQMKHMKDVTGQQIRNYRKMPFMIIRHIIKQIAIYSIPFIVLYDDLSCDFITIVALTAVVVAIAGVIPSPGGIGSTEFAFVLLLAGLAPSTKILTAALLYRFFSYYFPGLLGGLMILVQRSLRIQIKRE